MADLKENQMAVVTPAEVRCLDSAGNSGVATPVSILGRAHSVSPKSINKDLNNATESGIYVADFETENTPINDYGLVEVIKKGIYIVQKFYALNAQEGYVRKSNNGSTFGDWLKIY
mgnify:CR=1 FL=1